MEILDLYDDYGNKLNETINRGEVPSEGKNIMLSVIFIKNADNKYLIQKSSKAKGGLYTTTGGHVIHNETGLSTIIREVAEEIGVTIAKDSITHIATFKYPGRYCLFNVYLTENNKMDISNIKLQQAEVENVYWLTKDEILNLIDSHLFLESHGYIFKKYLVN